MLKRMICQAIVEFTIKPIDPLLIKSGQATVSGVDMAFVKTYRVDGNPEPFIPGTSLKGLVRSMSEKICRSLRAAPVPVCLPYLDIGKSMGSESGQASCSSRLDGYSKRTGKKDLDKAEVYSVLCPACRMYGSQFFIGRCMTSDGYLTDAFRSSGKHLLETRNGVAIDRLTGGAARGALFDMEVLTRGDFGTRIEIINFERWQLGLLALVLREMEEGNVRIGMGKSRGLGRIQISVDRFELSYFGKPRENLCGLNGILPETESSRYGLFKEIDEPVGLPEGRRSGLKYVYDVTPDWKSHLDIAVSDLAGYIETVKWPESIDSYTGRS